MRRRNFIALLGGATAAWALAARAQQAIRIIGFLNETSLDPVPTRLRAFRQGLSENGYIEGQNVAFEYRWGDGQDDRLPELAADLVRRRVNVIVTSDGNSALAAKKATSTIPIVFRLGADPVEMGLVASMNRPGSNVTGATSMSADVGPKLLELLHELVPTASAIGLLVKDPTGGGTSILLRDLQAAARGRGLQLHVLQASSEHDFDNVFARLVQLGASGLVIAPVVLFTNQSKQLAALTLRAKLPAIYYFREFAVAGGLMSYGASVTDSYRLAGVITGQILKGAQPVDLAVQRVTKVELIVNLKTAQTLGISIPLSLLGRADEVIE
jgi:putative ABC transport system substrate-binding protein